MRGTWAAAISALALAASRVAHAAPEPGPAADPLAAVDSALDAWRIDDAQAALAKASASGPAALRLEVQRARLDAMRSRFGEVVKRLGPIVAKGSGEALFEARVVLGEALRALGKKDEAFKVLDAMAEDYNDDRVTTAEGLVWLGVGLRLTDYPKNAHRVFREALEKDPTLVLAKRAWADLYAAKYDYAKADPLYREVEKARPDDVMARVGHARVAIDSDRAFAEAVDLMTPLVAKSPACVPCNNVLALVDLHNERPEESVKRLEGSSLKVAPDDPEALALLGAAYYLLDDLPRYRAVEKKALAANPKAADFYTVVAEHAEREHRYVEAIDLLEKALALDPEHWGAMGQLGTGYSRTGQDDKAKATLDQAFEGDPFNVRVYNLLAHFYDKADKRFVWFDAAPMRVRVDKGEAPVLSEVLPPLLQEAEQALSKKYKVKPKAPLHIEIFKDTQTFAVRSTGLPGLAAHGICFGHVITARSPSTGDFNWAEVLWHELSHVYHIQMSQGRVPRWFTEGLAVLESRDARPAWEREQDRELRAALRAGKLRGIADFNLSFTQAKSIGDILVAYYQAYEVTRFLRDTFGFDKLREMLERWGKKQATAEVMKATLGLELAEIDKRFFAWLERELAYLDKAYPFDLVIVATRDEATIAATRAQAEGGDRKAKAELAIWSLAKGEEDAAMAAAEALLKDGDEPAARYVRALLRSRSDATRATAKDDWEALRKVGLGGVPAAMALAALARAANDDARAADLIGEAVALDPKDSDLVEAWVAALAKAKRSDAEWKARLMLVNVDQMNAKAVVEALGLAAAMKASRAEVVRLAEQATHIAPFSLEAQLAAAKALAAIGASDLAKRAARLALTIDPSNEEAKTLAR